MFSTFLACTQISEVFYYCVILHLLYDIDFTDTRKTIKHAFSMFYTVIKHGFLSNQSERRVLSIL